ncbi:hypothetical protein M3181_06075 [Mesobacillus maritimus]|uniref:hypothetical protein n=1 Tax=Mesobacillus maritimus TaxID=1643336 RepID=UPI00203A3E51|nr:hypothetical protein [Mesobacillus maritimus]MCM3668568.1 hypothetical protein [Mesobacillus maritimus]
MRRNQQSFNKYPYIVLLVIHTIMLLIAFSKTGNRRNTLMLLSSNIALGYYFEYFVVNLFRGYVYKPAVFKNKQFDQIFGAILSQAMFVPFTAVFITIFQLNWKLKWLFSFYFFFIENLFVHLRVYTHNWWRSTYTFLLLPFYFWISDKWYQKLQKGSPLILFFSFYNIILITCVNLLFFRAIRGNVRFGYGKHHTWREHFIIGPLYSIVLTILTAWKMKRNTDFKTWREILWFRVACDFLFIKLKWMKGNLSKIVLNLPYHFLMITISAMILKFVYREEVKIKTD